ncbi:MAG TPA: hypothetical protein VFA48_06930 [Gammaproteobacteria bacterium]|nr:hypothetical protein [Gammaproteobacteria bacterium]
MYTARCGGSATAWEDVHREARQVPVHNAKALAGKQKRRPVKQHGFEMRRHARASQDLHFFDYRQVVRAYYPQ